MACHKRRPLGIVQRSTARGVLLLEMGRRCVAITLNYKLPSFLLVSRIILIVDSSSTKIELSPCCSCAGSPV